MRILTTTTGYVGLFVANVIFASLVFVLAFVDRRGRLWWPLARMWGKTIYWGALTPIYVEGFERLGWDQPAILMPNHESYLDVPALIASCPVPLRFVARKEVFKAPIMGAAMWATGQISIDRSDQTKAIESLKRAAQQVAGGRTVLLFPEGTRSRDGALGGFKKGGFMLALESGAPIVPIGLAGTRDLVPRGTWMYKRSRVALVVGEPIATAGMSVDDRDRLMEMVRCRIEMAREAAQSRLRA